MGGGLWVGRFAQGGVLTGELFTVSRTQLPGRGGPCGVTKAQRQGLQYRRESCAGHAGKAEQLCGWVSAGSSGLGAGPGGEEGASVRPARPC